MPIINENDSTATAEIRVGDNDRLSARVAQVAGAELLVLLSDVDGLYTADPSTDPAADHIAEVDVVTPATLALAGGASSDGIGTGGMRTKLEAARIAAAAGCATLIGKGEGERPLARLLAGDSRGTRIAAEGSPARAYKAWIAGTLAPLGAVSIDAGAAAALAKGASLLPAGVRRIEGAFRSRRLPRSDGRGGAGASPGTEPLRCRRSDAADRREGQRNPESARLFTRRRPHSPRRSGASMTLDETMLALGHQARAGAEALRQASAEQRTGAIRAMATRLREQANEVLAANAAEVTAATRYHDRLKLDPERVEAIAAGLDLIAALPDPVGAEIARWQRPNGLDIARVRTPIGVIGMIYEAVPTSPRMPPPSASARAMR